ncbi:MAG: hypothetical protein JXA00_00080 [Candidatus Thermoplasmatota archaeon]|nr:hypothetical protein [Candidatus Thermoplasmatota archaeon]
MNKIFEQATIVQKNGVKHLFDAIMVTDKGIYTGALKSFSTKEEEFEEHSFIPRDQIEKILIVTEQGKPKEIDV